MSQEQQELQELFERWRAGSDDAVHELLNKYGQTLLTVIRQRLHYSMRSVFDSLDFLQDVWMSFFKPDRQRTFANPRSLVSYLIQMAQHKVTDQMRRRLVREKSNFRRETSLEGSARVAAARLKVPASSPAEQAAAKEEWTLLQMDKPPHQVRILQLLSEGYTPQETAVQVGVSKRTVYRVMQKVNSRAKP